MSIELDGQVVIVTGAGRGIGRAIAEAFAAAGAAVVATARSADQLSDTVAAIEAASGRALAMSTDVSVWDAVERVVAESERTFGPVDVLVNNAGVANHIGPLWEMDVAEWRRTLDINLTGTFHCIRAVLPAMVARGCGCIINVASSAAGGTGAFMAPYGASKAGVVLMTRTLAVELKEHAVAVFAINPGASIRQ